MKAKNFEVGQKTAEGWVRTQYWDGANPLFVVDGHVKPIPPNKDLIPGICFQTTPNGDMFFCDGDVFLKIGDSAWSFKEKKLRIFEPETTVHKMDSWTTKANHKDIFFTWDFYRVDIEFNDGSLDYVK